MNEKTKLKLAEALGAINHTALHPVTMSVKDWMGTMILIEMATERMKAFMEDETQMTLCHSGTGVTRHESIGMVLGLMNTINRLRENITTLLPNEEAMEKANKKFIEVREASRTERKALN